MPINNGRIGINTKLANPATPRISLTPSNYVSGFPSKLKPFKSVAFSTYSTTISGVTRDSTGAVLASVIVQLFCTNDDKFLNETVSDGSGNYTMLTTPVSGPYYIVAYKVGAPDVAGTSVNTLVGV